MKYPNALAKIQLKPESGNFFVGYTFQRCLVVASDKIQYTKAEVSLYKRRMKIDEKITKQPSKIASTIKSSPHQFFPMMCIEVRKLIKRLHGSQKRMLNQA